MAYISRHSGRRIRDLLATTGFDHERYYLTNDVDCFPGDETGNARYPASLELAICRHHLREELEVVVPDAVVPTGRHATATILAFDGRDIDAFLDCLLEPILSDALGVPVVPFLHPSYQGDWIPALDFEPRGYREAIAETLDATLG